MAQVIEISLSTKDKGKKGEGGVMRNYQRNTVKEGKVRPAVVMPSPLMRFCCGLESFFFP